MPRSRVFAFVVGVMGATLLAGCSDPGHIVKGILTLDGKPLGGATINFIGPARTFALTQEDGSFTITSPNDGKVGVPAGQYKITVEKTDAPAAGTGPLTPGSPEYFKMMKSLQQKKDLPKNTLPAKYAKEATTDLMITVPAAESPYPVKLSSGGK